MPVNFSVQVQCNSTQARLASLQTQHVNCLTPIFMPVGTHGAIRSQRTDEIAQLGFQMLLANTYHLILRPGIEFFNNFSLRKFADFDGGFLTDSGGFQVFSLSHARQITEEGAHFRSHIDGSKLLLTPELSIQAQRKFGSDIMMVLDECVASTVDMHTAKKAMDLTHRWATRSLAAKEDSQQGIFGIVQGACFEQLRIESAQYLSTLNFDGLAIGGLAVGESKQERESMCSIVTKYLPSQKPRYLMGVGTPLDILEAVARGVDMFDCVLPTMLGQQGVAFTNSGKIDLRKSNNFEDQNPIDLNCDCWVCKKYSRRFLHHLIKTYDVSSASFIGFHNLAFYGRLMTDIRNSLAERTFGEFYIQKQKDYVGLSLDNEENLHKQAFIDTKHSRSITSTLTQYEVSERKNNEGQYIVSIKHRSSGEVMHSSLDPIKESRRLYVEQSKLYERANKSKLSSQDLIIWDVGLGACTNASGVIDCYQETLAPIIMESFEITLEPLSLVLSKKAKFSHAQHPWVEQIFTKHTVNEDKFNWKLHLGDFSHLMHNAKKPDLIFYDPFSYKVDSPLWTYESFANLYKCICEKPAIAFTFSAATRVRAALLAAGFYVAKGFSTGRKQETTVFMTPLAAKVENYPLLDKEWLQRWHRSHTRYPSDISDLDKKDFDDKITSHLQFD